MRCIPAILPFALLLATLNACGGQQPKPAAHLPNATPRIAIIYLPMLHADPSTETVQWQQHEIEAGQTLSAIAGEYGFSLAALLDINPQIDDPALVYVGQVVNIPTRAETPPEGDPTQGGESKPEGQNPPTTPTGDLSFLTDLDINGVPLDQIIILNAPTIDHIRQIYARGQENGKNPQSFSKIGDSTIESPFFMDRFDEGSYNLGPYDFLQPAIDYYAGSFARQGLAVRRGMHSWSLFDPLWADTSQCEGSEAPAECELRLHRASIVFIRLGSNDIGRMDLLEKSMRQLIETCLAEGVIPIIGTKADRNEGSNANNDLLRDLAEDYDVPLWDFDKAAQTLYNSGLDGDGVHLTTFYAHDYTQAEALQRGYGVHTLTGLMMLYAIWQVVR